MPLHAQTATARRCRRSMIYTRSHCLQIPHASHAHFDCETLFAARLQCTAAAMSIHSAAKRGDMKDLKTLVLEIADSVSLCRQRK